MYKFTFQTNFDRILCTCAIQMRWRHLFSVIVATQLVDKKSQIKEKREDLYLWFTKTTILLLFTHPHAVTNFYDIIASVEHKRENWFHNHIGP